MVDISETIKFHDICVMLDHVKKQKSIALKEKYLKLYYNSFKNHRMAYRKEMSVPEDQPEDGGTSFYSVLRCLLPGSDFARKAYGLQIPTLGHVYIKILQAPLDSIDARRLEARTLSDIHGDYADIVHSVLVQRFTQTASNLTLKQVHEMLDTIAADDRKNTEKVLTNLAEKASAKEQMWFIRLLLKSMHLGIAEQRIFGILHPQAKELYQYCSSLERVCCLLANNTIEIARETPDVKLDVVNFNEAVETFQLIRPMLCEIFPGNLEKIMESDVLYMETKMDGERFQLHFLNGTFKYLSRNGNDYTYTYGDSFANGNLTPHLEHLLPVGLESIILDGEMMVWDAAQNRFRVKGENTDVKHLTGNGNWRPCFVVYDILFLNGISLLGLPYIQRTYKLKELLKEHQGVLQTMKPAKISSIDEFRKMFQEALDNHEEGVVVKKQNSLYRPGMRHGGGWYKVKADYIKGLTTEFDLIIMGGFYNRTKTFVESFLVGILDYTSQEKYSVYSVGTVTNVTRQRAVINDSLKPHWRNVTLDPPPMWYHYVPTIADGRPDVWIDPPKSTVLQIKAADLAPSSAFALTKSLHFPRVQAWRNDKVWYECMTLVEFNEISGQNQEKSGIKKINKRELSVADLTNERKLEKMTIAKKRKLAMEAYEKRFDATKIQETGNLFAGFQICILSGSLKEGYTPELLKSMVVSNGGEIVENPMVGIRNLSIAGDTSFRLSMLVKSCRYNIATMDWLIETCKRQCMELKPNDMLCVTAEVQEIFEKTFDKFGDSFTNSLSTKDLRRMLSQMDTNVEFCKQAKMLSEAEVLKLEAELYGLDTPNFFRCYCAFFYDTQQQQMQLAKLVFQRRCGVFGDLIENKKKINLICINLNAFDKLKFKTWLADEFSSQLKNIKVVDINYILHSDKANKILDICEYTWHDF